MADGDIEIKTKINTEGVQKDVQNLTSKVTSSTKAFSALGGVLTGVSMGLKASSKVIKETTDAYNKQYKAEKQLEIAAKNNPYLNNSNVAQLKNFASEMQKISIVGDEELLPLMAQLASAGRTQAEIQNIVNAALDLSASGMMSLDSAVTQLNASYNGNVGALGRQISELKNLTAEDLKNGKAVEIVAAKYKGMAQETAAATGSLEQMKNAQGDFNEALGKITKPTSDLWNNFWKGWYEQGIKRLDSLEKYLDTHITGKNLAKDLEAGYNGASSDLKIRYVRDALNGLSDENLNNLSEYYKTQTKLNDSQKYFVERIEAEKERREDVLRIQKEMNAAAEERRAKEKEAAERDKAALDFMNENQAALDETIKKIKLEAELRHETADEQEILNAYIQSYIDLVTGSDLVSENNPFSQKRLKELEDYAKSIKGLTIDVSDLENEIKEFLGGKNDSKLSDTIGPTIDKLKTERDALEENSDAWQKYTDKIKELEELKGQVIAKEEEAARQQLKETAAEMAADINNYLSEFNNIISQFTQILTDKNNEQTNAELDEIEQQYEDGLISYEEYCDKKDEIQKKAAIEQYKIDSWNYTSSLLTATANIAQGVTKAIAQGGVAGIITGALVSAAGAAQIASIVANKPQMPHFAGGGFVNGMHGATSGGDTVTAALRPGELVLNAAQQAQLWSAANGNGGGMTINVDVVNNMGDSAKVNTQLTANGLRVTVDKIVNAGLTEGHYNNGLLAAENQKTGALYL